ncbi:MAG: glycosyltransferase family 2 protein [Patescibacteria group bacterium]
MIPLSIIVPFYNAEQYIKTCLDSILNQTFKNFELIIVNDCSTDNTLKILNTYADKDKRIKLINHAQNLGVAGARNSGLKAASGDYVTFVDQDDWLDMNMYQDLMENALSNKADIVECNYEENGPAILENMPINFFAGKEKINEYIIFLYKNNLSLALWNKIYNLNKIKINSINFIDHGIVEAEDFLFNLQFFYKIDSIKIINKTYYHHTRHTKSLSFHKIENYFEKTENLINIYLSDIRQDRNFKKIFEAFSLIIIIKLRGILFQSLIKSKNHISSGVAELKMAAKNKTIKKAIFNSLINKNTKSIDRVISLLFCCRLYTLLSFLYYFTIKNRGDIRLSNN